MYLQINNPKAYRNIYLEIVFSLFFAGVIAITGTPIIIDAFLMTGI